MNPEGNTPPEPEDCLTRPYPSSQKGGTLVVERVADPESHRVLLADPDAYRPSACGACHGTTLHRHQFRTRNPTGEGMPGEVLIAVYICTTCEATWRVLPGFLARHLHFTWQAVEASTGLTDEPAREAEIRDGVVRRMVRPSVRTVQRWTARLAASARQLVLLLATTSAPHSERVAMQVGLTGTRHALVRALAMVTGAATGALATLAALVHRLEPGVRVM